MRLLTPGTFHGDEVGADRSGPWLALVLDEGGASLHSVRLSVAAVHDPIVDDEGETTGWEVAIRPSLDAVALVKGVGRAGRIPTALAGQTIEPGTGLRATIGGKTYSLSIRCAPSTVRGEEQHLLCPLVVSDGTFEERLFTYTAFGRDPWQWAAEYAPTVIWAGDIDGDGRLDLLLDTTNHYNAQDMVLYLSSTAPRGRLLSSVATLEKVGC